MLNLLHVSDLHFTSEKEGLRRDYSHAAAGAILRLAEELKAQGVLSSSVAVAITGDLVQQGGGKAAGQPLDFEAVQREFLEPLQKILDIGPDRIFMVPGNHEMDRTAIDPAKMQSCRSRPSESQLEDDLREKLKDYFAFVNLNGYKSVTSEEPRIASFECDGQQVVCWNGLAGSYSRNGLGDKGELLLLPTETAGKLAIIEDFSILITHHPLSWYCDDCEMRFRGYLASKRCRVLTGHIHNEAICEVITENGKFVSLQAGACSEVGDIHFSVAVAWLPTSNSAAVRLYVYDESKGRFPITAIAQTKVAPDTAASFLGRSEAFFDPDAVSLMTRNAREQNRSELFELSGRTPERFVPPDIMYFTDDQFNGKRVQISALLDDGDNVVLSGYELSGKSSLLAYLCYTENEKSGDHKGRLGLLIDFRELQASKDAKSLLLKRLNALGATGHQAEYLLGVGKVRIYIDNFEVNDRLSLKRFLALMAEYSHTRWTAVAKGSERFMPSRAPSDLDASGTSYYQLSEITLPTVLKMIESHEASDNAEKPRAIVQRVFRSIQNLSAPRTMFYVRSMLDIFLNDGSVEPLNRYLLIENIIAERIRLSHKDIFPGLPVDMQMLESFIGLLAHDLLERQAAFVTRAEFLSLVEVFIERKGLQRKRFDPDKILEVLTQSRVLRSYESGFGFIILSVEDYFLAKHMSQDSGFREYVLSTDGLLTLPAVAEYYIAQNPNDTPRIDHIFGIIDEFEAEVAQFVAEIEEMSLSAIRSAAPGSDCQIQNELLDDIAEVDEAEEPSMLRYDDPEQVGDTARVRYSVEERGAVLLQLGASILGVTRTLDQVDRVVIFKRLRQLLLTCVKGVPIIAQHLADGHEVRMRGTTVKAEYIGKLAVQDDRFYIILRGMLYSLFKNFSTWAGSPSFFNSAVVLREEEQDEIVATALFAQNIEADLGEALQFVSSVSAKVESMILKEVVARLYLDAMTLVPLERSEEKRGVDALVNLTAEIFPPQNTSDDAMKRHKDKLRKNFSETIGINTYIGRRALVHRGK